MTTKEEPATKAGKDDSEVLERRTTSEGVALILRKRILEGYYAPEQFLRQEDIANQLGVSRVPVREALQLLQSEGLVTLVKYRGAIVPRLSLEELTELCELRLLIEPYLMLHAIENVTVDQLSELRAILKRCSSISVANSEWVALNVDFHMQLYAAANKPVALQSLRTLLVRADRYLKAQRDRTLPNKKRSDDEHRRIFELVEARDAGRAVAELKSHITWNANHIVF